MLYCFYGGAICVIYHNQDFNLYCNALNFHGFQNLRLNDSELYYHALHDVHNGTEAMTIFPQIQFTPPEEQQTTRHNILKYCELDTYAMVKLWEKLKEAAK